MLVKHGSTGNIMFEVYADEDGNIKLYIGGEGGVSGSKYDVSSCEDIGKCIVQYLKDNKEYYGLIEGHIQHL